MKRSILLAALVSIVWSCNSNNKKQAVDTKTDNEAGVENVNGNIPDTTNAINLNTHKKDSAGLPADSAK